MLGHKQPGETLPFTYDFRPQLAGAAIQGIMEVTAPPSEIGASAMTIAGQAFLDGIVTIYWSGGQTGISYLTNVKVSAVGGAILESGGEILIEAAAFQIPAVTSTYLAADEYVARFGREETIRVTDETRMGKIDAPKLQAALDDATEFAEGYLRSRYQLPLASSPAMLKGIIAALAREELHRTRPLETVTLAAERARQLLRDISLGRIVLSLIGGEEPVTDGASLGVWGPSQDARVFTADKLAGY